jgi:hypothetical protein
VITLTPSFRWRDLAQLFFNRQVNDGKLAQRWCKKEDDFVWFSKLAWSLRAIALWWEKSLDRSSPTIWVPGCYDNRCLCLLRQTTAKLIFYPVQLALTPDWDACRQLAEQTAPDIFLLPHFYGVVSDARVAKKFCADQGALFIEDASHMLMAVENVGERGDFVLYGLERHGTLSQGSLCVMRPSAKKYVKKREGECIALNDIAGTFGTRTYPFFYPLLKQALEKFSQGYLSRLKMKRLGKKNRPIRQRPCMSRCAKKLLFIESARLSHNVDYCQKLEGVWVYLLRQNKIEGKRVLSDRQPIFSSFLFDLQEAGKLVVLRQQGWPVVEWPELAPEVSANAMQHSVALKIKANRIIFSVHRSLNIGELVRKCGKLKLNIASFRLQVAERDSWERHFLKIEKNNLSQSWFYGDAKADCKQVVKRFIVMQNDQPVALLQVIEKKILGCFKIVHVNRGPLFFQEDEQIFTAVFAFLMRQYRWYKRTLLLMMPEMPDNAASKALLYHLGYKQLRRFKWSSIWIDLAQSKEDLRLALRSNWRRQLSGSEKKKLLFLEGSLQDDWRWLLDQYQAFTVSKGFSGVSYELLDALVNEMGAMTNPNFSGHIYKVIWQGKTIAGTLIVRHGLTATYLLVWTDPECGRDMNVSNFLVWHAMIQLKTMGCKWFDLGGIAKKDSMVLKGIDSFKYGLGGVEYQLVGGALAF